MTPDNRLGLSPRIEAPRDPYANRHLGESLARLYSSLTTSNGHTDPNHYIQIGSKDGYRFRILQGVVMNGRVTQEGIRDTLKVNPTFKEETFEEAWGEVQGLVDQIAPRRVSKLQEITHFIAGSLGRLIRYD